MRPLRAFFSLISLGLISLSTLHAEAPRDLQLFLLIGQSNMAGRGAVEPQDQVINPRIFMLNEAGEWVPAKDPVHFDKTIAGVGLCSEFARTLARRDETTKIGLLPCAVGGTSLDQWKSGGKLYSQAIARTKLAQQNGHLAGILWHQGEADASPEKTATYGERFAAMIKQLRTDLGAESVPVIVGELGRFRPNFEAFNANLPAVVAQVPHCALATTEELKHKGDQTHFDSPSLRTFGTRYAEAYLKLAKSPGAK